MNQCVRVAVHTDCPTIKQFKLHRAYRNWSVSRFGCLTNISTRGQPQRESRANRQGRKNLPNARAHPGAGHKKRQDYVPDQRDKDLSDQEHQGMNLGQPSSPEIPFRTSGSPPSPFRRGREWHGRSIVRALHNDSLASEVTTDSKVSMYLSADGAESNEGPSHKWK